MLYRISAKDVNSGTPTLTGNNIAFGRRTPSQRAAVAASLTLGELAFSNPTEGQACQLAKVSRPWARLAARLEPELRRRVLAGELSLVAATKIPTPEMLATAIAHFGAERALEQIIEFEKLDLETREQSKYESWLASLDLENA